jgi:hypothetical protein
MVKTEKQSHSFFSFNNKTEKIKIADLKEVDHIEIPFDKFIKTEFKEVNDTTIILYGLKLNENAVTVYTINTKNKSYKVKNISFKHDLKNVSNIGYINSDSIFLAYSPMSRNGYHDDIVLLINDEGAIKKSYSFKNAPVLSKQNPQYKNNDQAVYLNPNIYQRFNYFDNKLFLNLSSQADKLGEIAYANLPIAGCLNTETEDFSIIDINYPNIEFGKNFFPNPNKRFFTFLNPSKNELIYGFRYTSTIIRYNYSTGDISKHQLKSSIYDSIFASNTAKETPNAYDFKLPYPKYFRLHYDKYRNYYYRTVFSPWEYGLERSLIIADSSFNFMAEGFPAFAGFSFLPTKDYIVTLGSKTKKPSKEGSIILTFNKLELKNGTNQELIAEIKSNRQIADKTNKPITHYVKKHGGIKNKNYTATFLNYGMCPNMRDLVLGFYKYNEKMLQKHGVYLFLISDNAQQLKDALKEHNLDLKSNTNIVLDSTLRYLAYSQTNNDLVRVIKIRNKKIENDTLFKVTQNFQFDYQNFIINSGKEQKSLKDE